MSNTTYTFDSVTDFFLSLNKPSQVTYQSSQIDGSRRDNWYGTDTYADALRLALNGWPEGRKRISDAMATLSKRIATKVHRPITTFDVSGEALEIGRFVSGEPECFMTFEESEVETSGHKIVKIVASLAVSGGISTDVIEARGVAIAALVEALELNAFRCEVWIDVTLDNPSKPGNAMVLNICVKQASAPLQMDSLAFTLTHPSMFRRMVFRFMETNLPKDIAQAMCGNGYGRIVPMTLKGDLSLDSMLLGSINWTSPQSVEKWLLDTLKTQGVQVSA